MSKNKKPLNPFYPLLVVVGVIFTVTACAYGLMMYLTAVSMTSASESESPLIQWLGEHGALLLAVELGVLIAASLAAMATDGYWTRRLQATEPTSDPTDAQ